MPALQPGVQVDASQQQDEIVNWTFDFTPATRDTTGVVVDPISGITVTHTVGIAIGTTSYTSTTVKVPVDTSGMAAGSPLYTILVVALLTSGAQRNFAIQITVLPKATV